MKALSDFQLYVQKIVDTKEKDLKGLPILETFNHTMFSRYPREDKSIVKIRDWDIDRWGEECYCANEHILSTRKALTELRQLVDTFDYDYKLAINEAV